MESRVVISKIETRQSNENNSPRYIVNGTAIVAGTKYPREWVVDKAGRTVKVSKEMFTPNFIRSMKEQAKKRNIFVDIQHELVRDATLHTIFKGKFTEEEEKDIETILHKKMVPLAKCVDIDIEGDSLKVYTELNPLFPTVDDYHRRYFDAIWGSLKTEFLNGISLNFHNWKFIQDAQGDTVADDADLLGISYVAGASNYLHSIDEVAIRQFEKTIQTREGERKMEDEKQQLEAEKNRIETEKKNLENERIKYTKDKEIFELEKSRLQTMQDEEARKAELAKQMEEQKKIQQEIADKTEAAKKLQEENTKLHEELNRAKGVVSNRGNPNMQRENITPKFYEDRIKAITAEHDNHMQTLREGKRPFLDNTMKGFSELEHLQAKAGNFVADLEEKIHPELGVSFATLIRAGRLLDRSGEDIVTPNTRFR